VLDGTKGCFLTPLDTDDDMTTRHNAANSQWWGGAERPSYPEVGISLLNRLSSTIYNAYANKNKSYNLSETSTGVPNLEWYALCANNGGSPFGYSTRQIGLVFIGGGATQTHINSLVDDFETYMDSRYTGVIT
jgi:hypothetical protein